MSRSQRCFFPCRLWPFAKVHRNWRQVGIGWLMLVDLTRLRQAASKRLGGISLSVQNSCNNFPMLMMPVSKSMVLQT